MIFRVHPLAAARSLVARRGRKVAVASWCGSIQRHSSSLIAASTSICGEMNTTTTSTSTTIGRNSRSSSSSSEESRLGLICLAAATTASAAATKNQEGYLNSTATTTTKSSSSLTFCESAPAASNGDEKIIANNITDDTNTSAAESSSNIPLWPSDGETFHEDVDILVDEILKDPTINLSLIPDGMEFKLYRSTIVLTLNIVYRALSKLDGLPILAHRLQLSRSEQQHRHIAIADIIQRSSNQVNDEILEQIADRLLANPSVNATLIPDAIERQVYVNCLKVIFRVLLLLANSFTITICGHDIKLVLEPSTLEEIALEQSTTATTAAIAKSSTTQVDMEILHEFAAGVSGIEEGEGEGEGEGSSGSGSISWWDRLRFGTEFNKRLHASLYGLILGIVDDIMANTKIKILSDDINLDMIAAENVDVTKMMKKGKRKNPGNEDNLEEAKSGTDDNKTVSVGSFAAASFVAGVGVGVASMAVLSTRQQR